MIKSINAMYNYSNGWNSFSFGPLFISHRNLWDSMRQLFADNMDSDNLLLNAPTQLVFKFTGCDVVYSMQINDVQQGCVVSLSVGTSFTNGTVQNATAVPVSTLSSSGLGAYNFSLHIFLSPTGFHLMSCVENYYPLAGNSSGTGFCSWGCGVLLDEDTGQVIPNQLQTWGGVTPASDYNYISNGWLTTGLYDRDKGAYIYRGQSTSPFMAVTNINVTMSNSQDTIYGSPVRSPFPPYREMPMFRVFGADSSSFDNTIDAERTYKVGNPQITQWFMLTRSLMLQLPLSSSGHVAMHWSR